METRSSKQGFVAKCLAFSFGCELLTPALLNLLFRSEEASQVRLALYTYAVSYSFPLFLALWWVPFRGGPSHKGKGLLDAVVALMAGYWLVEGVSGLVGNNDFKFVLSDSFNFLMPCLSFFVASRLSDAYWRNWLFEWMERLLLIALPVSLLITFCLIYFLGIQSGGQIFYLLYPCWFLAKQMHRPRLSNAIPYLVSIVLLLGTLKRAIILAFALHFPLVLALDFEPRRAAKALRLATVAGGLALLFLAGPWTPNQFSLENIWARLSSLNDETAGFTHLQAREDEVRGILAAVDSPDRPLDLFFGLGAGATYTALYGATSGNPSENIWNKTKDHDSHISPFGWILRGGIIGMSLYLAFYGLALLLAVRATLLCRDPAERARIAALTAFGFLAVGSCLTSFSLTPSPLPHVLLALAVGAGRRSPSIHSYWDFQETAGKLPNSFVVEH